MPGRALRSLRDVQLIGYNVDLLEALLSEDMEYEAEVEARQQQDDTMQAFWAPEPSAPCEFITRLKPLEASEQWRRTRMRSWTRTWNPARQ